MEKQRPQSITTLQSEGRIVVVSPRTDDSERLLESFHEANYDVAHIEPGDIENVRTQAGLEKFRPDGWILAEKVPLQLLDNNAFKIALLARTEEDETTTSQRIANALDNHKFDLAITQPVTPEELIAYVDAIKRRWKKIPADDTQKDVVFDFDRCRVLKKGEPTNLTKTETLILKTITKALGRTVTPSELSLAVWGYEDANLKTHIRRLRQKIEGNAGKRQTIQVVRNSGYRIG